MGRKHPKEAAQKSLATGSSSQLHPTVAHAAEAFVAVDEKTAAAWRMAIRDRVAEGAG